MNNTDNNNTNNNCNDSNITIIIIIIIGIVIIINNYNYNSNNNNNNNNNNNIIIIMIIIITTTTTMGRSSMTIEYCVHFSVTCQCLDYKQSRAPVYIVCFGLRYYCTFQMLWRERPTLNGWISQACPFCLPFVQEQK